MRFNRRALFRYGTAGLLASGVPGSAEGGVFFWKRMFSIPPRDTSFITPNDKFYLVQYNGIPALNIAHWELRFSGRIRENAVWTYADFLARPSVEAMVTLKCIDTLPGGSTIGNAVWQGFPLSRLLEEAGMESGAVDVVFHGADGYSDSIPVERVMQGDVLLAHSMNGTALPRDHGYPLRIIAPGLYGIKNVKWLTEIEVVDYDYKGYWQQRGWTDEGRIKIFSRIDRPGHYQDVEGPEIKITGLAFAGAAGVKTVLVSTNGGKQWREATIVHSQVPAAWVLWEYPWRPPRSGAYTLVVKAIDSTGRIQSPEIIRAYPAGASGFHTIVALAQ
jgi:hypothetical protein